jgi:hypothetical protein
MPNDAPPASAAGTNESTHSLWGPTGDLLAEVPQGDRLNRLQSLIAEWLRMENIIVLLGAGSSVSQGGPLMGQLESYVLG